MCCFPDVSAVCSDAQVRRRNATTRSITVIASQDGGWHCVLREGDGGSTRLKRRCIQKRGQIRRPQSEQVRSQIRRSFDDGRAWQHRRAREGHGPTDGAVVIMIGRSGRCRWSARRQTSREGGHIIPVPGIRSGGMAMPERQYALQGQRKKCQPSEMILSSHQRHGAPFDPSTMT